MAVSFDKSKPGTVLYDVHSEKAGNTTMRRQGVWQVYIKEIDTEKRQVFASWNGNPARWQTEYSLRNLRLNPPEWVKSDPLRPRKCHFCYQTEETGHAADCAHPRANKNAVTK